jgi:hypothetical protein
MLFTAPGSGKHNIGVVTVYSVNCSYLDTESRMVRELLVGSPPEYNKLYEEHLPRRLPYTFAPGSGTRPNVRLAEDIPGLGDYDVDATLFALPSNQVVLAVSFEFTGDIEDPGLLVQLLEKTIDGQLIVMGKPLTEFVQRMCDDIGGIRADSVGVPYRHVARPAERPPVILLPERHQVVFLRRSGTGQVPSAENVHRILYRNGPPYTEEFARP